jgi:hypothetical protein
MERGKFEEKKILNSKNYENFLNKETSLHSFENNLSMNLEA